MAELRLLHLCKQYKDKQAVDHVNAVFHNGVYGLLGANGAGKTTLLRMLCNILTPTGGEILWEEGDSSASPLHMAEKSGMPIQKMGGDYRRLLGYLPQDFGFYPDFTAERYLRYLASLKALPAAMAQERCRELIGLVGLSGVEKQKLRTYSGGMLRRLGIAQALLNDPEILILDEPTAGLDPKERIRFRNIISSLGKNRIVILSTHIVSDVEFIADHIMLMKNGQLIRQGTPRELISRMEGNVWECRVPYGAQADRYSSEYAVSNLKNEGDQVVLRIVSAEEPVMGGLEAVCSRQPANLEDAYLFYMEESGGKHEDISNGAL